MLTNGIGVLLGDGTMSLILISDWVPPSHFLSHVEFLMVLVFYHSNNQNNPASQRYDINDRNAVLSIVYNINYLQLVVLL